MGHAGRQAEHSSADSADSRQRSGFRSKFRGLLGRKGAQSKPEATVVVLPAKGSTEASLSSHGDSPASLSDASPPLRATSPAASPAAHTPAAHTPIESPTPPPQAAPLPASSSPVAVALSPERSLWDQAYDKLGQKNPGLVKDYEKLLEKESQASGELRVFC